MARVEKQNPSVSKASFLSHSVQQEDETDVNQRASSGLGHVTEEEAGRSARVITPLIKDGSSYNIATSDITALPTNVKQSPSGIKEAARDASTVEKPEAPLDSSMVEDNLNNSHKVQSPQNQKSLKNQDSKESISRSPPRIQNQLRQSMRMSKISVTQRSKASLQSRISKQSERGQGATRA